MREIDLIVVHCSATKEGETLSAQELHSLHTRPKSEGGKGWSDTGYHYYYTRDGQEHVCRPIERQGAHVRGHNKTSVGLSYEGGLDANGIPEDTRTGFQKDAMSIRIRKLRNEFGPIPVVGHRDLSPDKNGDGTIDASERLKECPCYDAIEEHNSVKTLRKYLIHFYN